MQDFGMGGIVFYRQTCRMVDVPGSPPIVILEIPIRRLHRDADGGVPASRYIIDSIERWFTALNAERMVRVVAGRAVSPPGGELSGNPGDGN
jgi:hypothetical protein